MIGDQIKALRKALGKNQQEFGERIGLKGSSVSNYEVDRVSIPEAVILSIVREYKCDELWLRTGEGDMFRDRSEDEELAALFASMLQHPDAAFPKKVIAELLKLPPEAWAEFRRFLQTLSE